MASPHYGPDDARRDEILGGPTNLGGYFHIYLSPIPQFANRCFELKRSAQFFRAPAPEALSSQSRPPRVNPNFPHIYVLCGIKKFAGKY
jgi:hypothetical protein